MKKQLMSIAFAMLGVSIAHADGHGWQHRGGYYRQPQINRYYGRSPMQGHRFYRYQPPPVYNRPQARHYGGMVRGQGPVNGAFGGNYPAPRGFGAAPGSLGFGFGPASGAVFGGFGARPGR